MDKVILSCLILPIRIGHQPTERAQPQQIRIDLVIETDFTEVLAANDLGAGVDYSAVRRAIKEITSSGEFILLENLADTILQTIFQNRKAVSAKITVRKLKRWKDAIPGVTMTRRNI